MLVSEVIQYVKDATATPDDLQNRTISPLFTNAKIVRQLKIAMDRYANYTKGIEAYCSQSVATNQTSVAFPAGMIRSEGLRFISWFINGYEYSLNIINLNNEWGRFPVSVQGLPRFAAVWQDRIKFYPQNPQGYNHGVLTNDISATDTTIQLNPKDNNVLGTAGFIPKEGRITIDDEIIAYSYISNGAFYNCRRGLEDTTATTHITGTQVNENNLWIYYYRLNFDIPVNSDDSIDADILNKEILIADDHMETIIKYTTYNLLLQIDIQRAAAHKVDWQEWLKEAKRDINKGRSSVSRSANIRDPWLYESDATFYRA